jgi:hypothetical protein
MAETGTLNIPVLAQVTVQIDPADLLDSQAPGYNDYGDEVPCGPRLADQIRTAAARHVAEQVKKDILTKEFREELRASIRAQVDEAVREALEGEYQPVDTYGSPKGAKTSLRAEVGTHIAKWANATGDQFTHRGTNLQQYIREEVDAQIKADLGGIVKSVREQVKGAAQQRITSAVADVMAGIK